MEELIPTIYEEGEERIDTVQEGTIIAGVQTINGKAGDLDLKTINGQDILTAGDLSLATTEQLATKQDALTETQLNAVNSGIDADKVQQIADNTTAIAGKQDQLTQTQLNAVNSGIDETKVAQIATNTGNITSNTNRITTIEGKIPSTATSTNQLTDKNYVDNSIATNTADYISDNGQPFQSLADLEAYSGPLTNNDYAFVVSTDSAGNLLYTRYKYNSTTEQWAEEYTIANPTFTSTQWASIDSGVTANDVTQIGTNKSDIASLQSGKQDALSQTQLDAVNSGIDATKVQQIATNASNITSLQTGKQDKLTAGTNIQISGSTISATDTKYSAGTGLTLSGTTFNVNDPAPSGFFTGSATTTSEGTDITLPNALGTAIKDVQLKGDTEQTTLSGKNLLLYPYYDTPNSPVTRYDVTWTDMGDGTVKANGTPSGASQFIFFSSQAGLPIEPNTTYTISGGDKTKGVVFAFDERDAGGTIVATHDNVDTLTFTTNENAHTLTGGLKRYSNSITIDNFICKPQLEKGSTPTSWEQYCGGLPSPNPDFPQDINVVTGEQRVTTTNVNMLAIADTTITPAAGGTIVCDDGTVYVSGTNVGQSSPPLTNYMDCRAGNTYTLSANASMANSGVIIRLYRPGGPSRAVQLNTADAHGSFTFTEDEKVRLEIRLANGTSFAEGFYLKPQLEIGSEPTPYQKRSVQVHNINLGKNICSETKLTGGNGQIWFRLPKLNSGNIVLSAVLSEPTSSNTVALVIDGVWEALGTVTAEAGVRFGLPLALTDAQVQAANQSSDAWIRIYKSGADFRGSDKAQIEYGTSVTSYAPYFTPIELCKVGNYQDYIYKNNGDWYKHNTINKITLKGTENWQLASMFYCTDAIMSNIYAIAPTGGAIKSDYFIYSSGATNDPSIDIVNGYIVRIKATKFADTTALTTWLGTHNTTVYYPLATATDTQITNATLIAQLEALASHKLATGQNSITSSGVSPNLDAILTIEDFNNNWNGISQALLEQ